jgi:putative ABC transport system ATP-binding protein
VGALDSPSGGRITVGGRDITSASRTELARFRRETVAFVFQTFNLFPGLTARENVEFGLAVAKRDHGRRAAVATLERVGLGHRHKHRPAELSGGEQQRVTIARALAGNPALVWADEPTGNLDSETAGAIIDLLAELNREGLTLVLVTHDAGIGRLAGRLIRMRDGAIESTESLAGG